MQSFGDMDGIDVCLLSSITGVRQRLWWSEQSDVYFSAHITIKKQVYVYSWMIISLSEPRSMPLMYCILPCLHLEM